MLKTLYGLFMFVLLLFSAFALGLSITVVLDYEHIGELIFGILNTVISSLATVGLIYVVYIDLEKE